MNLNLERVRELIEELEQHRQLIDEALKSLTSLENAFNGNARSHAAKTAVAAVVAVSGSGTHKTEASAFACVKHPHSREFSARGQCKMCQSEYMKEYWAKKKKTRGAAPIDAAETGDTDDASDYVKTETLATQVHLGRNGAEHWQKWEIDGEPCEIGISKA